MKVDAEISLRVSLMILKLFIVNEIKHHYVLKLINFTKENDGTRTLNGINERMVKRLPYPTALKVLEFKSVLIMNFGF